MASSSFGVIALLFGLLAGGANDLLDFVSSAAYWKAKNVTPTVAGLTAELTPAPPADMSQRIRALGESDYAVREEAARELRAAGAAAIPSLEKAVDDPDREIAGRARSLLDEVRRASRAGAIRKLMAIRSLGEMKDAKALPVLKSLLNAPAPFVGDYAAVAVAQIEGRPLPVRGASAEALRADLSLLPANCGFVGQVAFPRAKAASIEKVAADAPAAPGEDRQRTLESMATAVISVAEQVGNIRVEAITFGVSDDVGERTGFAVAILRGRWDAGAIQDVSRMILQKRDEVEGVSVVRVNPQVSLALASDERLIAWAAPAQDKMPVKELLAAARANKGPLLTNPEVAQLVAAVDPRAMGWAVCRVSPAYRVVPVVDRFETITLTLTPRDGRVDVRMAAVGADAGQVKDAVNTINRNLATIQMEIPRLAEQVPALGPVSTFVKGIVCEADGVRATLTGTLEGEPAAFMAIPLGLIGGRAQVAPDPPGGQRQKAEQIEEEKR